MSSHIRPPRFLLESRRTFFFLPVPSPLLGRIPSAIFAIFMDECVGNTGKCSTFAAQSDDLRFFYCSISLLNWYLEREERAELISVEAVPSGAVFTIGY